MRKKTIKDNYGYYRDNIRIRVPNMDKNGGLIFDIGNDKISCQYNQKYSTAEINANKSGLIALAKMCLQLAYSSQDLVHVDYDQYTGLEENSCALVILKTDNS